MDTVAPISAVKRSIRKKKDSSNMDEENDGGFRFTRCSKRLKKQNEEKEIKPDNGTEIKTSNEKPQNSEKAKAKQKRRSSFIRGRKPRLSLEICESEGLAAVKGLHKKISADLNSSERLLLLFEKSLQLMFEKLKNKENENVPDIAEKAEEFIAHLRTAIKTSLSKRVTNKQDSKNERIAIPNPKNEQLEEYAKKSQEVTERMQLEDKEWEDLLHKYQDSCVSSAKQLEDTKNSEDQLDCMSSELKEFLSGVLPLQEIMERVDTLKSQSYLMVDEVSKLTGTLKAFNDVSGHYIEESTKTLEIKDSEGVTYTPHQLFKGTM